MESMLRCQAVMAQIGKRRTSLYEDVRAGVMTPPIKLGQRSVGWPSSEVQALLNLRIAGGSQAQLRLLVQRLIAERASKMPKL